ncbi:MAG: C-GCAxxG-C-C family protein [Alistipes sp.]|jgi:C_GCAxxG_C_C family probable redox protein|nr:C-GCAxxG-C-C family protein [Alistipes sp.]
MTRAEIALEKFGDFHCAQSVVYAFADDSGIDADTLLALATGFGVGIGRKQEVCGAVAGAVLLLGARYGRRANDSVGKTERSFDEIRLFMDEFTRTTGTIKCLDLLGGCDLTTDEGRQKFQQQDLKNKVCRKCIEKACELLQPHFR